MANPSGRLSTTKKVFRSLFDEHRIIWDILRNHSYFVAKRTVKQFIPPESFITRNYTSNNETCKIRMSRLQILPWLSLFVTPDNAILYSERDPIVPTENTKWRVINYDKNKLDIIDLSDTTQQGFQTPENPMENEIYQAIQFIPSRDISIPQDNRVLNFNPNAPADIKINSTIFTPADSICNPQLDLEIGLSTREDFHQGNTDNDINRFASLDYNKSDDNRKQQALLRTTLHATGAQYNPNYTKLDDSWNKYLASIDEDNYEERSSLSEEPAAKRSRENTTFDDIILPADFEQFQMANTAASTSNQPDFFS